jgi:hypothetical protein
MKYKLNPAWPADSVCINGQDIDRSTILAGKEWVKYLKPTFKKKPPILVEYVEVKQEPPKEEVKDVIDPIDEFIDSDIDPLLSDGLDFSIEPEKEDDLTQLDGIGIQTAKKLIKAGFGSFEKIANVHPVNLAMKINRTTEFTESLVESAKKKLTGE